MRNLKLFQSAVFLTLALFVFESLAFATLKEPAGQNDDMALRNLERMTYPGNTGTGDDKFGDSVGVRANVRVPDHHTVVMSGSGGETREGVPVLSKIPLLGRLFRSRSEEKEKQKLLVVTKPVMIDAGEE